MRHRVAVAAAVTLALAGCSQDQPAAPSPTPTQTPSPTPSFTPVVGERVVTASAVSAGPVVFNPGTAGHEAPPPNSAAIDTFADAVADWLDAHLDDLQRGGEGQLALVAAPGLLEGGGGGARNRLTTALASENRPVRAATYTIDVVHDGDPLWLQATVVVTPRRGDDVEAQLVFLPGGPQPVLVAAEPPQPPVRPQPGPSASATDASADPPGATETASDGATP